MKLDVCHGFPVFGIRIVYESLPEGIAGCDYTVSVACTRKESRTLRVAVLLSRQCDRLGWFCGCPDGGRNSTPVHRNKEHACGPGELAGFKKCHNYTVTVALPIAIAPRRLRGHLVGVFRAGHRVTYFIMAVPYARRCNCNVDTVTPGPRS